MYMRENRVDLPYWFLHLGFSIVASLAIPEEILKIMDVHERKLSGFAVFFLHCVCSIVASPAHPEGEKMLKNGVSISIDFCIRFRTIPVNPT